MNIDRLLRRYFSVEDVSPTIEVFDKDSIYAVYSDIVRLLNAYPDIELSVLQALSYCFYEVLDNVLTHSEKFCGTIIMRYVARQEMIQVLVADDGIGVRASLAQNVVFKELSEADALMRCIEEKVTDGKGMGFGLYSTARLIKNVGIRLVIHSGHSMMTYDGQEMRTEQVDFWQGTLVYFELHANREIDPNEVVDNRMDCAGQFNDMFLEDDDIDELW